MTAEQLRSRVRRKPFTPFRLHLSGGTSYPILRPELILVVRDTAVVAFHASSQDTEDVPSKLAMCSIPHVTKVEDLPAW